MFWIDFAFHSKTNSINEDFVHNFLITLQLSDIKTSEPTWSLTPLTFIILFFFSPFRRSEHEVAIALTFSLPSLSDTHNAIIASSSHSAVWAISESSGTEPTTGVTAFGELKLPTHMFYGKERNLNAFNNAAIIHANNSSSFNINLNNVHKKKNNNVWIIIFFHATLSFIFRPIISQIMLHFSFSPNNALAPCGRPPENIYFFEPSTFPHSFKTFPSPVSKCWSKSELTLLLATRRVYFAKNSSEQVNKKMLLPIRVRA